MKQLTTIFPILFLSLFLSFTSSSSHYLLLDQSDFDYTQEDNKSAALSIPEKNFYSYNIWQCFDSTEVQLNMIEIDYNGWHQLPSLNTKTMTFDIDPDLNWDQEKVFNFWDDLIQNSQSICIFGAYLQGDQNDSLWYVQKIKTNNGYWDRSQLYKFLKNAE